MSRPSHIALIAGDLLRRTPALRPDEEHLEAAIQWLCRGQDRQEGRGVSAGYYPAYGGWLPAYPETTGYVIPTLLRYFWRTGDERLRHRAMRLGDWEISIQLDCGGVRGGVGLNDYPIVFNTGQVLHGWCALFREVGTTRYLDAACRAGDWLVETQDADGKWSKHCYKGVPHAYHTRVAWPLLELHSLTGEDRYLRAAERHHDWVVGNALVNGWCRFMGFTPDEAPLTHTIAYTLHGLLESAPYVDAQRAKRMMRVLRCASDNLLLRYERRKPSPEEDPYPLPARFDEAWRPRAQYSCLTGNAQLAILWIKLYQLDGDVRYLNGALKLIDQVKSQQSLSNANDGIRGAIGGSYPCWGGYNPFSFPNWATKFFADALMEQETVMHRLEQLGDELGRAPEPAIL